MDIHIASASAEGLTLLAAFDAALLKLGVGDHNLVHLSSVIPLKSRVVRKKLRLNGKYQGDRIYCVFAENRTNCVGHTVAAGLGWVMTKNNPKWGLFVEHTGHTKQEVEIQIKESLETMTKNRPAYEWGRVQSEIVETKCVDYPVCAMALAAYQRVDWYA